MGVPREPSSSWIPRDRLPGSHIARRAQARRMTGVGASPLAVGLVGAGPWAEKAYAPMLAAGPETRLQCVWARRPEAARALADAFHAEAMPTFEALLGQCEAVAFAVPPDIQS